MTDSYRGIAKILQHHKLSHWLSDDIAAAEDDTLLSAGLNIVMAQQRHDAERCGRNERRLTYRHTAHIDGMESVDILAVVDSHDDFLFVDVLWQRQLYDESVDISVSHAFKINKPATSAARCRLTGEEVRQLSFMNSLEANRRYTSAQISSISTKAENNEDWNNS